MLGSYEAANDHYAGLTPWSRLVPTRNDVWGSADHCHHCGGALDRSGGVCKRDHCDRCGRATMDNGFCRQCDAPKCRNDCGKIATTVDPDGELSCAWCLGA